LLFLVHDGFVGTILHAHRHFLSLTEVAFRDDPSPLDIAGDHSERAHHHAHPAAHTAFFIAENGIGRRLPVHGPGKTGVQAWSVLAVPALEGKGKVALFLYSIPRLGFGVLPFVGFQDIAGLGMLNDTVHFAQSAIDAELFPDKDALHLTKPLRRL
jgi:hypothetical protein